MVGLQEALRSAIAYGSMASGATALEDVAANAEGAVRILLDAGVSPDAADETGWTPLMSAVLAGEVGIVRALLEAGADPEHTRVYRGQEQTPISLAEEEGQTEILALLQAARDADSRP
jgi:ankyrin repeat protein